MENKEKTLFRMIFVLAVAVCCMAVLCAVWIGKMQLLLDAEKKQYEDAFLSAERWETAYNNLQAEIEAERLSAQEEEEEEAEEVVEIFDPVSTSVIYTDSVNSVYDEWGYDFGYVVRVVGAEARGEPFEGIMAVAQCIRTTAGRTGQTPEQVVKVPGQYASPVSVDCDDNMETVNEACLLVFGQGESAVDDTIEYFCSVNTNSRFHNSLRYVCTIGSHNFYSSN